MLFLQIRAREMWLSRCNTTSSDALLVCTHTLPNTHLLVRISQALTQVSYGTYWCLTPWVKPAWPLPPMPLLEDTALL